MKSIIILLALFSLNTNAITPAQLEARCFALAFDMKTSKSARSKHLRLAMGSLTEAEMQYEMGYVTGVLERMNIGNSAAERLKKVKAIYKFNCKKQQA